MIIVTIVLLLLLVVLLFLAWIEVIPIRKWTCIFRIKAIGMKSRYLVEILDLIDEVEKWINNLQ